MSDYLNRVLSTNDTFNYWKAAFSEFKKGFDNDISSIPGIANVFHRIDDNLLIIDFDEGPSLLISITPAPGKVQSVRLTLMHYYLPEEGVVDDNEFSGEETSFIIPPNTNKLRLGVMFGHALCSTAESYERRRPTHYPKIDVIRSLKYGCTIYDVLTYMGDVLKNEGQVK